IVLLRDAEPDVYTYVNKERCEQLVKYELVHGPLIDEAEALALAAWRGVGCRDGGRVDVRADASGRMQFLEINPLARLHPGHSDLPIICTAAGIPSLELIRMIVDSARERVETSSTSSRSKSAAGLQRADLAGGRSNRPGAASSAPPSLSR